MENLAEKRSCFAQQQMLLTIGKNVGISSMRERAILCGGELEIETMPGRGTCLTAELPLDVGIPDLNGLEVTRRIHPCNHSTRVVILSMHAKEAYVLEALRNEASAYVLKDSDSKELIQAIRQSMQGIRYLSPPLSERAIEAYLEMIKDRELDPYDTLTNREREILHLVLESHSNAEIARRLTISPPG